MTKFDGKLTITRREYDGDEKIHIEIKDENSGIYVAKIFISLENFSCAITGCSYQECHIEYGDLENVGKTRVNEDRQVEYTGNESRYNRQVLEKWLEENCQEEGYKLNSYLGSKSSVIHVDNKTFLNYSVTKFI